MVDPNSKLPWFITRQRALALGFDHEGTHFGIPIWCEYNELNPEAMGMVACKWALMEPVLSLMLYAFTFLNALRPPGEESDFPFLIKPIEQRLLG